MHDTFDQLVCPLGLEDPEIKETVYGLLAQLAGNAKEAETERQHKAICDCVRPFLREAKLWTARGVQSGTLEAIERAEFCLTFLSPQR